MSELESCVQLVVDCGLSTGHADSHEQLLREVLEQHELARVRIEDQSEDLARSAKRIAELEAEIKTQSISISELAHAIGRLRCR